MVPRNRNSPKKGGKVCPSWFRFFAVLSGFDFLCICSTPSPRAFYFVVAMAQQRQAYFKVLYLRQPRAMLLYRVCVCACV